MGRLKAWRDSNYFDGSIFPCFYFYYAALRACYVLVVFYSVQAGDGAKYSEADGTDRGEFGRLSCQHASDI